MEKHFIVKQNEKTQHTFSEHFCVSVKLKFKPELDSYQLASNRIFKTGTRIK